MAHRPANIGNSEIGVPYTSKNNVRAANGWVQEPQGSTPGTEMPSLKTENQYSLDSKSVFWN